MKTARGGEKICILEISFELIFGFSVMFHDKHLEMWVQLIYNKKAMLVSDKNKIKNSTVKAFPTNTFY